MADKRAMLNVTSLSGATRCRQIDGSIAELAGDLNKQRGPVYLTRSGQKLDSPEERVPGAV
jgi:hypothetical protein